MRYKPRDLRYNNWHFDKLPREYYAMDIDFLEIRKGRGIVALVEVKNEYEKVKKWQLDYYIELSGKLNVPAYLVIHRKNLTEFKVTNLITKETKLFDEQQHINFIKNL